MLTEQAAWYREALRLGLCSVDDVIQWTDTQILELPEPPHELLELSRMGPRSPAEIAYKLETLSASISTLQIIPKVLKSANERLMKDKDFGPPFADALARLAHTLNYPVALNEAHLIAENYQWAKQGGHSSLYTRAYDQLLEFTAQFVQGT